MMFGVRYQEAAPGIVQHKTGVRRNRPATDAYADACSHLQKLGYMPDVAAIAGDKCMAV
jgi:hypothetical protein